MHVHIQVIHHNPDEALFFLLLHAESQSLLTSESRNPKGDENGVANAVPHMCAGDFVRELLRLVFFFQFRNAPGRGQRLPVNQSRFPMACRRLSGRGESQLLHAAVWGAGIFRARELLYSDAPVLGQEEGFWVLNLRISAHL